jgi:hypothetical protein
LEHVFDRRIGLRSLSNCYSAERQVFDGFTGRSINSTSWDGYVRLWPGRAKVGFKLVAENRSSGGNLRGEFRRHGQRRLMAGRVKSPMAASEHFSSQNLDLAGWPVGES